MSVAMNASLREEFKERGYVKIPGFFSAGEIISLRRDIADAATRLEGPNNLDRNNMLFYSNLFKKSAAIQSFVSQERIINLICSLAERDLWVRWDQCVAKAPGGAEFPWHQDNAYSRLKDEHCQLWIAVTDMTLENGGLWVQPGSHKHLWPHKRVGNHLACTVTPGEETFCEAKMGDVIVFSSKMLHRTKKNNSASDRWAYVIEYMSQDHYDPIVEAPFFIVAEDGKPAPRMVETYRGHSNLSNRFKYLPLEALKYVPPPLKRSLLQVRRRIKLAQQRA